MRLIDADKILNAIQTGRLLYIPDDDISTKEVFKRIDCVKELLETAPASYDIDKVTDALIHSKEINEVDNTEWVNLTEAIMIVRNNGEI